VQRPDVLCGYASDHVVVRVRSGFELPLAELQDGGQQACNAEASELWEVRAVLSRWNVQAIRPSVPFRLGDQDRARRFRLDRYFTILVPSGADTPSLAAELGALDGVIESAELDWIGGVLGNVPDDPLLGQQFAVRNLGQRIEGVVGVRDADVDAPDAWSISVGAPDVVLTILDTGVSHSHPELAPKLLPGYNFTEGDPHNADDNNILSHGTHTAGIAAAIANNGFGIAGLAWDAPILPVRIATAQGISTESWCAAGILWAAEHGARVASMSLGFPTGSSFFADAVAYAYDLGLFMCASSGNTPGAPIHFPARFPQVVAVGATDNRDRPAAFTSGGPEMAVAAPGVDVLSTWDTFNNPNGYRYETGTSMACPHVAGLACLILSVAPQLSNDQVRLVLTVTADDVGPPGWDSLTGYGRINAGAALRLLRGVNRPRCRADWNEDGILDSSDLFEFITDYIGGRVDLDGDGVTDSDDFFAFIELFLGGCS
jgi:subtilisin family serine protease